MEQMIGTKYETLKSLGEGGMGEVFLARDLHLNRPVAVKRIKKDEKHSQQARREMEFLRELEHPNLPAVYDFLEEKEWFYLIMEYVEGITLEQYLKKNHKAGLRQTVLWGTALTEVLGYLHNRKPPVLYRDLKPGNIMIRPGGDLKLIDLGACVKSIDAGKEEGCVGTYGYAPPEQWSKGKLSVSSDIYSLGVVLHEMVTGAKPSETGYERRPVREYDRSIPIPLEKVIEKCCKKEQEERYQTMESVRNALLSRPVSEKIRKAFYYVGSPVRVLMGAGIIALAGCPLLRGIPEAEFPFPYLIKPLLLMAAAGIVSILLKGRSRFIKKIEKSMLITEKKFDGLYVVK